jgi:hypothetical protein
MTDPKIQHAIDAKRSQLEAAKRALENAKKKVETLQAELRGAEELARVLAGESQVTPTNEANAVRKRGLSDPWRSVIAEMAECFPKEFTLPEITALCAKHGIKASSDTIRGQMHHHRQETQFVESNTIGRFRVTEKGAAAAGVTLGDEIPF